MAEPAASGPLRLLLVEDEPDIRRMVRSALEQGSYRVSEAWTVSGALVAAADCLPDLVLLDLGLPDGDGVRFITEFRVWSQRPVLVLSARNTEGAKIAALDAGADDFLTKPFVVGELLARIRALLRRGARDEASQQPARIEFGDVTVDLARHEVLRAGDPVHLTAREFRLLAVLVANSGRVLTHRHLLREVWGAGHTGDSHYLRVYIGRLRQKLECEPALPRHILTEIGVGYRFVP